jgi:hypothetical protein
MAPWAIDALNFAWGDFIGTITVGFSGVPPSATMAVARRAA